MDDLAQDLRFAARTLLKNPGFAAVIVATLALGIGANTAIFSLMDQVLLRMLPVHDPGRLVVLSAPGAYSGTSHQRSDTLVPISHPMFEALRDRSEVFEGVLAHVTTQVHLTAGATTEAASADIVSGTFFPVLGLAPAAGRLLGPADDVDKGAHPVVVLGHGYWTRRFGADPKLVGQSVRVNSQPMTVVGIAPAGFQGVEVGGEVDVYLPLAMLHQAIPYWERGLGDWRARFLTPMARLKPDVTLAQAEAGANVLYRSLLDEDLATFKTAPSERFRKAFLEKRLKLLPGARGASGLRDQSRTPLFVLTGMVGLVLLIACANVANLLLARASARRKEIAVRLAMGASRRRIVRQLLVESLGLSIAGGMAGLLVASWTGTLLVGSLPYEAATRVLSTEPDLRVASFALALSFLTGVLFGLAPALQATRTDLAPTLKNEAGALAGAGGAFRFRKGLVVAQVALSLLLLIGAGLFARSLVNLRSLDPGFQSARVVAFSVDPSLGGHALEQRVSILNRIREDVAAEPGVASVSLAEIALMTDSNSQSSVRVEGYEAKDDEDMNPNFNGVAPGFFEALGIPLVAGRDLTDADAAGAPRVAVVNEVFARYFFKGESPVGRRFGLGRRADSLDYTIVGVVRDGKAATLREEPKRFAYTPFTQSGDLGGVTFYVRTAADVETLGPRLRRLVAEIDPQLPVTDMKTMQAQIRESLFVERLIATLSAAFGLLATFLAALGLYGVMSQAVAQRTREIGIRMALGAERRSVFAMVLRDVALLVGVGVALGLPGGYGLGRVIESQLFGLSARDPLTFGVATLALLAAALVAGYVPAARATRVDPVVALRYD
jgi:predicted permease